MIGYEEYLKKYPKVARSRSDKMLADSNGLFVRYNGHNLCLFPDYSSSDGYLYVDIDKQTCECNVFRTRKACPHVAAALGMVEKNGGKIPFTDSFSFVNTELDKLINNRNTSRTYIEHLAREFEDSIGPFLGQLSEAEKSQFLLKLAYYVQTDDSVLDGSDFVNIFDQMDRYDESRRRKISKRLFEERKNCLVAVTALVGREYTGPFSKEEQETVLHEVAADDELAVRYLPLLAYSFSSYFSREQLIAYLKTQKISDLPGLIPEAIMKRMLEDDPPLYDEYLEICNKLTINFNPPELPVVEEMIRAGYADRMENVFIMLIKRIRSIDDYLKLRRVIPHEYFLKAWRDRYEGGFWWSGIPKELDVEICFREDPETNPDKYNLEELSNRVLEVIQRTRPEYAQTVNNIARKRYRYAMKANFPDKAKEALMVLIRGGDTIAVKYVSEWNEKSHKSDDLMYLAAVGERFDVLEKVVPELKKMEVNHASR